MTASYVAMPEPIFLERDNATLLGALYRPVATGRRPTMIYAGGFPSPHVDASDLANAARADGWNVITFRYRGTWGSTGVPSLAAWTDDLAAFVSFASDRLEIDLDRLAFGGTSFGALLAGTHAAWDDRVRELLLISPRIRRSMSADILADPRSPAAAAMLRLGGLALASAEETTRLTLAAELIAAPSLLEVASRLIDRRVFVASGDRDAIPLDDVRELVRATGAEWFRHAEADHGFTRHREVLVSRVAAWLAAGGPGRRPSPSS